jgi:hypothetical protein
MSAKRSGSEVPPFPVRLLWPRVRRVPDELTAVRDGFTARRDGPTRVLDGFTLRRESLARVRDEFSRARNAFRVSLEDACRRPSMRPRKREA